MKSFIKIFICTFFILNVNSLFSQNLKIEIREIKSIFYDISEKKLVIPIYNNINKKIIFPNFLSSCKEYYTKINKKGLWPKFTPSKINNLNTYDCYLLNKLSLIDSNTVYLKKEWFTNDNIFILTDTMLSLKQKSNFIIVKPIFFNNYERCLITIDYYDSIDSFFLKKIKNHWVFDKFYFRLEQDIIN